MISPEKQQCWNRLLDAFRGFGGVANNVIQRPGPLGLGLFPIDPAQPIELRVPQHLLIPVERVALEDGAVILKNDKGFPQGYADWFQDFQADYSWGAEAQHSIQTFENNLQSLPSTLREQLSSLALCQSQRLEQLAPQNVIEQNAFDRFIQTRQIQFKNSMVLMPIIELINHSPRGRTWTMDANGISVGGSFENEVLVRYSISDPVRRLMQYGFNCTEPTAFSVSLQLKHRNLNITVKGGNNFRPGMTCDASAIHNQLIIRQPLLGSMGSPKAPRTLFKRGLKSFNVDANELFDQIHHLNRIAFIQLLRELETLSGAFIKDLRKSFLNQLVVLSRH